MSSMESVARAEISQRRDGRRLTDGITGVCRGFLAAACAVDEACARRHALWLRDTTTYLEDQAAERDEAAAWERCFLAAVAFDDALPDTGSPVAELVQLMAQLAAPLPGEWLPFACVGEDGASYVAYHQDGRGRTTATLTAYGEVVPTSRVARGWRLPAAPAWSRA